MNEPDFEMPLEGREGDSPTPSNPNAPIASEEGGPNAAAGTSFTVSPMGPSPVREAASPSAAAVTNVTTSNITGSSSPAPEQATVVAGASGTGRTSQKTATTPKTSISRANPTILTHVKQRSHKRRNSTDILLIAAAQKDAEDKEKSNGKDTYKEASSSTSGESPQNQRKREVQGAGDVPRSQGKPQPHVYHDYSAVPDTAGYVRKKTGGVSQPFPEKLMDMLAKESNENQSIISWLPHGRAFLVLKPKEFADIVMPKYFRQTKITSFQRQLNLYGFRRLTRGPDAGAYYHEMFLRGREQLCTRMTRQKVKGVGHKQPSHAESEPNLYALPRLPDDSSSSAQQHQQYQQHQHAQKQPQRKKQERQQQQKGDKAIDVAGFHQTPVTATQYYTAATITTSQEAPANHGSALVSPALQAARLLKSMATAKVTPGSFPPMLTLGSAKIPISPKSSSNGSARSDGGVPPPPLTGAADKYPTSTSITSTSKNTRTTSPGSYDGPPASASNTNACRSNANDTVKHEKDGAGMNRDQAKLQEGDKDQKKLSLSVVSSMGLPSRNNRSSPEKLTSTCSTVESPQKVDTPQPPQ